MLEFQLTAESISTMPFWMASLLGLSTVLTLISFSQLASARFRLSFTSDRLCKGLLALLASLQIFAWQLYFYRNSHDTVAWWCFATAMLGGAAIWHFSVGLRLVKARAKPVLPLAVVLVSVIELAGFAQATLRFSEVTPAMDVIEPGRLVVNEEATAVTDKGTPIRLSKRDMSVEEFKNFIAYSRKRIAEISAKAMLREEPFMESNCHGWVFTGGKHIIQGADVSLILAENGYVEVIDPQPNDVAIYRDKTGFLTHTALVRGELGGAVMVEGKWGIGALYIHVAEQQPYGTDIKYYRTDRESHVIQVLEVATSDASKAKSHSSKAVTPGSGNSGLAKSKGPTASTVSRRALPQL